jgi:hypothetical protein
LHLKDANVTVSQKENHSDGCLLSLKIFLTVIGGLGVLLGSGHRDLPWKICIAIFAYSLVSLKLNLGWCAPSILAGALLGLFLDPWVKGGTLESQADQTEFRFWFGTGIGFVIGIMIEFTAFCAPRRNDHES